MVELADTIALGAIGATLGGSNPLPPKMITLQHPALIAPDAYRYCVGVR